MSSVGKFTGLVVMIALCLGGIATAQTGGGVIGVVRDESGGAVPGAAVKVVNESTGEAVDTFTNEHGSYDVAGLARGQYRVEVMLDGFESIMRRVVLDAGQTETVEITLAPARFTEGVVVTARRVEEVAQEVPIPVSVLTGELVADAARST